MLDTVVVAVPDFHHRLLLVAQAITLVSGKSAVDLEALWKAHLYVAKTEAPTAARVLDEFRSGWDWRALVLDHFPPPADREFPFGSQVKRLVGPLDRLKSSRFTEEDFLQHLTATAREFGQAERIPGLVTNPGAPAENRDLWPAALPSRGPPTR